LTPIGRGHFGRLFGTRPLLNGQGKPITAVAEMVAFTSQVPDPARFKDASARRRHTNGKPHISKDPIRPALYLTSITTLFPIPPAVASQLTSTLSPSIIYSIYVSSTILSASSILLPSLLHSTAALPYPSRPRSPRHSQLAARASTQLTSEHLPPSSSLDLYSCRAGPPNRVLY
jgi:hypothetical protein